MKKKALIAAALLTAVIGLGRTVLHSQTRLEPYIELELKRVEETYRLMDAYAQTIWPGWNNYMEVEFRVQYPNLVYLLIGPRDKVPEGYELVPDRTVRGKKIYVNRKDELPIKIGPPLTGGGGGGLAIRIKLRERKITQEEAARAIADNLVKKDPAFEPAASSDSEILLYVHEFFHGFQTRAMPERRAGEEIRRIMKEAKASGVKPDLSKVKMPRKRAVEPSMDFDVNPEYSTYSNIEGLALRAALEEKDKAKAIEGLKDYIVAREIKHSKYMTPGAALNEALTNVSEGTAVYSNTRMAMLIRDRKYKPAMGRKDDPFFYGFGFMDQNIYTNTRRSIDSVLNNTLDTLDKCYTYGVYQCLVLDRLFPGWNKGFFESEKTLDEFTAEKLRLSEKEKAAVAGRLKAKYDYDRLYAKHAAVIAERDSVRKIVTERKGRTYVIDFQKTREFLTLVPRGRSVTVGVSGYFVNGISDLKLGDIELTTWNTPIHKPFLYTLEWTDTEVKPDEKNYTFNYERQEGDVYKNVVFTTPGFTLKAPEVKIKEDKDKNQFLIYILRKVAS